MKTVKGKVVSTKPISLSNAAKYISRFTSSDTGASSGLAFYLHRVNSLAALHKKPKGGEKNHSRRENPGRENEGKGKNDSLEVEKEETVKIEQSPDEISGRKRKKAKKSDDFEQEKVENGAVIVKTEPEDGVVEKKRKKRKKSEADGAGIELKQEIVDGDGNAVVDGVSEKKRKKGKKNAMEVKQEMVDGDGAAENALGEGGKKRKHMEVVGEDLDTNDLSGKKKKKKRKIEGEGK